MCEFFDWSLWNLPAIYCLKWKKIFPYNCQFLMTILESPHMFLNRTTLPQTYWPSRCWFSIAKVFLLESCGGLFLSNKVWFLVGPVGQFTVWVALIKGPKIMFLIHKQYKGFFINFQFFEITVMWRPKWACCVLHYCQKLTVGFISNDFEYS